MNRENDFEEITLAIVLLGGVLSLLLTISDFFKNNVIQPDSDFLEIIPFLVFLLLAEFLIILLFFLFKGISRYIEPESWKTKITKFTHDLFKFSFIYFLIWLISLILIYIFVYIFKVSNYYSTILISFILIILFLILWDYSKLESFTLIFNDRKFSFRDFWKRSKKLVLLITIVIVFIFLATLFLSISQLFTMYYLSMGSYSIEEFLQPNDGNITVGIKETGVISNANFIALYKMDNDYFTQIFDEVIISNNQINSSIKGFMIGTHFRQTGIWYLTINTSNLQSGNYMLHAEVTLLKSPILGTVKKHADKSFYIPPNSTKYFFNSAQGIKNSSGAS